MQGEIFGGVEKPLLPILPTSPSASVMLLILHNSGIKKCYMLRKRKDIMLKHIFLVCFIPKHL